VFYASKLSLFVSFVLFEMIKEDGFCARKSAQKMSDLCFGPFSREEVSQILRSEIWTMEIPGAVTFDKKGVWT
jgi:hypothetical protein